MPELLQHACNGGTKTGTFETTLISYKGDPERLRAYLQKWRQPDSAIDEDGYVRMCGRDCVGEIETPGRLRGDQWRIVRKCPAYNALRTAMFNHSKYLRETEGMAMGGQDHTTNAYDHDQYVVDMASREVHP